MRHNVALRAGRVVIAVVLLLFGLWVRADSPAAASADANEIDRLVRQLGSDEVAQRQAAEKALKKVGEPALSALAAQIAEPDAGPAMRAAFVRDQIVGRAAPAMFYSVPRKFAREPILLPDGRVANTNGDIFDNAEALRLYEQACAYDPMHAQTDAVDRDKAVELYAKAIDAQPWAAVNAAIANRIGQMYGFYEDREKGVRPDRAKAAEWWRKCAGFTSPQQVLWVDAQIGLRITGGYRAALGVDSNQLRPPLWKLRTSQQEYHREVEDARRRIAEVKIRAVEQLGDKLGADRPRALEALRQIARDYRDTPPGDKAVRLLGELAKALK